MAVLSCKWVLLLLAVAVASVSSDKKFFTPKDCTSKIKIFTSDNGEFTSPGGWSGYGNNTNCTWQIKAPQISAKVKVFFTDFDVEPSKDCVHYDSVAVKENCNGSWSRNLDPDPHVHGYCGNRTDFSVTSNCGNVVIIFKTDDSVTRKGFNVSFEIHRESKPPVITCIGKHCNGTQEEIAESNIYVNCVVEAYPPPTIYWTRVNGSMPVGSIWLFNGTLKIEKVREEHTGIYECFTNNTNGSDTGRVHLVVKGCL
ncbi:Tolloid-like protein 2 [Exaiptasia diaphana]|nr:Tolloid-like protein 2 [Exaiptasia diaphana]